MKGRGHDQTVCGQ